MARSIERPDRERERERDRVRDRDSERRTTTSRRDSETKRYHSSKFDREPSPKRSRRDGKPETERTTSTKHDLDAANHLDHDQKQRRRLQDAVPLEAPLETESKVVPDAVNGESNKKIDGPTDGTKHPSDPTKIPKARSYFQHDERSIAGQGGRSFGRRETTEHEWWGDTKDRPADKFGGNKVDARDQQKRDERTRVRGDDNVWRHDRFHELEADAPAPARKRPAFREKKEPEAGNAAGLTATESGRPVTENPREEKAGHYSHDHGSDRSEKTFRRDSAPQNRGETQRSGFSSRERFAGGGGGGSRVRDRFTGRYGERNQYRPNSQRADKWKHDLYDEASKSPPPKNEEDQIAKLEKRSNGAGMTMLLEQQRMLQKQAPNYFSHIDNTETEVVHSSAIPSDER